MVGNGCVSSEGLVDWMLYLFFSLVPCASFFFAYERMYGVVCKIKGDIGFLFFENKCFTGGE